MSPEEKGFRRTLRLQGRDLKLIKPAQPLVFRGTINRFGAFLLNDTLAVDPRGQSTLEIATSGAPTISSQNILRDQKTLEQFKCVAIGLDCPAYSRKFALELLTTKDSEYVTQ